MRRLLMGRAGTGKTHACLDRLRRALAENLRARLLVPTYGQAEHLRLLLLDFLPGFDPRVVCTFSSLAEDATGIRLRTLQGPAERDRAAERALQELFPAAAAQAGFRAEFLSAVKEIKECGLPAEEAARRVKEHFPRDSRGARLFAAQQRYATLLGGPDHEDLLALAAKRVAQDPPRLDLLCVDGFEDFTQLELSILKALSQAAKETLLTLPLDPDDSASPIFSTAARTAAHFPGYEKEPRRKHFRAEAEPLAHLERSLFRPRPSRFAAGEAIELLACSSAEDEADRLARLVRRSKRPYRDFLLIRRSFAGLHESYRAAFRRHGIPLRFFQPEPLAATPAGRAAALLLRHRAGLAGSADLLPLWNSPFLRDPPPAEERDRLARHLREKLPPEDWSEYPAIAARLHSLEEAAAFSLPRFLESQLDLEGGFALRPEGNQALALAARLLSALVREAEAVADLPPEEGAARVLTRLPLLRGRWPDRRHDCVYAVEALDARQWQKPVVFAAGLGADAFPRQVRQDLFLRDEERRRLAEERGVSLPLRARREEEERYLFYVALTRARQKLVLSYVQFDEEGTALPPSPFLEEALEPIDGLARREVALSEQFAGPAEVVDPRDLFPLAADGLARAASGRPLGEPEALAASLYDLDAVSRAALARPRRLELARSLPVRNLPRDPAQRLSASAINDYLRCPYLFFAARLLRLRPERALVVDPALRGEILHEALARFFREDMPADPLPVFDAEFAERTKGLRLGLAEEAQRRWMRRAMGEAAERMRGLPVDRVEREFEFMLDDVTLRGRMDRVDVYDAGELVRDYKSGTPHLKAALEGSDVQLDLYLLALKHPAGAVYERLRKGDSAGFVLEELGGEVGGRGIQKLSRAELEERLERTRATVRRVAAAARAGRLAVDPRDPSTCARDQCDGFDLCRVARARFLARKARELAGDSSAEADEGAGDA